MNTEFGHFFGFLKSVTKSREDSTLILPNAFLIFLNEKTNLEKSGPEEVLYILTYKYEGIIWYITILLSSIIIIIIRLVL